MTWPKEYGGQGLGPIEQVICNQEIGKRRACRASSTRSASACSARRSSRTATEEQKARYLGPMLHGDEVWCQLFSEPAAGSDLAAVQTRARQQDDGSWRLTGQKVWTTNAQFAAYGLLLARTDADVPKHKGLTMFIVPMDAAGVTIRGLRQISGEAEFNEVFFDDVALAGRRGRRRRRQRLEHGADDADVRARDDRARRRGAGLQLRPLRAGDRRATRTRAATRRCATSSASSRASCMAVRFTGYRTLTALQQGQVPGPEAGLAKVTIVSGAIKAGDLIADVIGPEALAEDSQWAYMISFLPGLKSAGGTEEILRNMIGERVLGLPPEPRLDKGIPFSELRAKEGAKA